MITDKAIKSNIAQQWTAVEKLCDRVHRSYQSEGGTFINETRPSDSYNLPFVLGYAVLDQVLTELRNQGLFKAGIQLGDKMRASKHVIPWQDYAEVCTRGRLARKKLTHKAEQLSEADCRRYIAAIGNELRAWGIV